MNEILNILCLEDSPRDAEIIREFLIDAGYDLNMDCTDAENEFVALLRSRKYDLILSDFKLPGFDAFAALRWSVEICPDIPFICVSGTVGEETAVELLKKGAVDYILKDRLVRLPSAIQRALYEVKEKEARQQGEEKVKEMQILLQASIESPKDMIVLSINKDYRYLTFNTFHKEVMKRAYGKDVKNGMNLLECITNDDDRKKAKVNYDLALAGESHYTIEEYGDLERYYYETRYNPIVNDRNEIIGATAFSANITARKLMEEKLLLLSSRQEAILASVPDIIMEVDNNKVYTWANKSGFEFFGNDVIGKEANYYFEGQQQTYKLVEPLFNGGENTIYIESWQRRKDGEKRLLAWWCRVLKDLSGEITGALSSALDITERKKAEDQIIKLNESLEQRVIERTAQLEDANKELEAFSYSVSHDLRAPLRSIHSFTNILLEEYKNKLDDEGKRLCGIISSDAIRMSGLIDDLLNFSRIGRSSLNVSLLDMKSMAGSVFTEIASENEKARTNLKIGKLHKVYGDAHLIRLVWNNLISNAIKYSSKKEISEISIGSHTSGNNIAYYIKDNGVGFDMFYKHKLFGVFQRLHSGRDFEGNGVGLAIVQRIIQRHDGKVWAEGEVDKGATFYFSLRAEGREQVFKS